MKTTLSSSGARMRSISRIAATFAAAASVAIAAPAEAQEPGEDDIRFRGGIQSAVGPAIFVGKRDASVVAGITGRVGVQLGETFGVFAAPQVEGFMGEQAGPYVGMAIMGDVTVADTWAIGFGPEMGVLAPSGEGPGPITSANAGLVGRFALYPERDPGTDGRRSGLAIGLDLHARFYGHAYAACGGCEQAFGPPLLLQPMLFIGHEAY